MKHRFPADKRYRSFKGKFVVMSEQGKVRPQAVMSLSVVGFAESDPDENGLVLVEVSNSGPIVIPKPQTP